MVLNSNGLHNSNNSYGSCPKTKKKHRTKIGIIVVFAIITLIITIKLVGDGIANLKEFFVIFSNLNQEIVPTSSPSIIPSFMEGIIIDEENSPSVQDITIMDIDLNYGNNKEEEKEESLIETFAPTKQHKTHIVGNGNDIVTIMIYMNGSDLESENSSATKDLKEIIRATSSDKVNIVIQTMSTKKWDKEFGISGNQTQRYKVNNGELVLIENLEQLSCGDPETLSSFITWSTTNYPANRNILIMWNHGGGAVFGFGNDQFDEINTLTIDEMKYALQMANITFDFIGMDCCIMSSIEVCYALYDYCDYMILSEDFESSDGWYYTNWIDKLAKNTSMPTEELGKIIIDDMTKNYTTSSFGNSNMILSLIDASYVEVVYNKWKDFAYANTEELLNKNYSVQTSDNDGRVHPLLKQHNNEMKRSIFDFLLGGLFGDEDFEILSEYYSILLGDTGLANLDDYYITDMTAIARAIPTKESKALLMALHQAIVYVNKSTDEEALFGMSVTLPYGDKTFYEVMQIIYYNVGIDEEYINWLEKFVYTENYEDYYDYDDWFIKNDDWFTDYDYYNDYDEYNNLFTNMSDDDFEEYLEEIFGNWLN